MNRKLVIIGAGGHGKVCANVALDMQKWDEIVFLDDYKQGQILECKIVGTIDLDKWISNDLDFFVAIGNNDLRLKLLTQLEQLKANIVSLIHPSAYVARNCQLDKGIILMPYAILNPDVNIGFGSIINSGALIEHDTSIGKFCHISPGVKIAGNVIIRDNVWIGLGTSIINNVTITEYVTIGAASLVLKDIKNSGTYYGHPLK